MEKENIEDLARILIGTIIVQDENMTATEKYNCLIEEGIDLDEAFEICLNS